MPWPCSQMAGTAATGAENGTVYIWNVDTCKLTAQWKGHSGPISEIAISAGGRHAITSSQDHKVILWNTATGSEVRRFTMPNDDEAKGLAILRDGNILAAGRARWRTRALARPNRLAVLRQARPPFVEHNDLVRITPRRTPGLDRRPRWRRPHLDTRRAMIPENHLKM